MTDDYTPMTGHPVVCIMADCDRRHYARGLCEMHYARAKRSGSLPPKASEESLFWARVEKTDSCWLWVGHTASNGYGRVVFDGVSQAAHRVAYKILVGPIPEGSELDHVKSRGCISRACVNPAHLEPVTHRENTLRGETITAAAAAKSHCPRGHALVEGNLVPSSLRNGRRGCLTCSRERARQRREKVRYA